MYNTLPRLGGPYYGPGRRQKPDARETNGRKTKNKKKPYKFTRNITDAAQLFDRDVVI